MSDFLFFTIRVLAGEEENHHTKSNNVVTEPTPKSVAVRDGLALVKLWSPILKSLSSARLKNFSNHGLSPV